LKKKTNELPQDEYENTEEECPKWCADWTPPGPDGTIGLLWDTGEGSLTICINGANIKK